MDKFKRFGVSILSLGLVLALNPVKKLRQYLRWKHCDIPIIRGK